MKFRVLSRKALLDLGELGADEFVEVIDQAIIDPSFAEIERCLRAVRNHWSAFGAWYEEVADKPGGVCEDWQMIAVMDEPAMAETQLVYVLRGHRSVEKLQMAMEDCHRAYSGVMSRPIPQ
jgi:hypothetical protein